MSNFVPFVDRGSSDFTTDLPWHEMVKDSREKSRNVPTLLQVNECDGSLFVALALNKFGLDAVLKSVLKRHCDPEEALQAYFRTDEGFSSNQKYARLFTDFAFEAPIQENIPFDGQHFAGRTSPDL